MVYYIQLNTNLQQNTNQQKRWLMYFVLKGVDYLLPEYDYLRLRLY